MFADTGIRCDRHMGDAVKVRCNACQTLSDEYGLLGMRLCPRHPAHFRPCEKNKSQPDADSINSETDSRDRKHHDRP
jgi:hypothetical protein